MFRILIFFHQPQTVSLTNIGDLLVPVDGDSLVEVRDGLAILLHLEI